MGPSIRSTGTVQKLAPSSMTPPMEEQAQRMASGCKVWAISSRV